MLRGEQARRRFSLDLPRGAAEIATVFQLAFKNTVTLLSERSHLELIVNGHSLAVLELRSSDAVSVFPVTIPRGILSAGANEVEIVATMAHRVDCSVAGTYELWTAIDPSRTGIVLPDQELGPARGLRDVALEPLDADGTTHLSIRLPTRLDEAWIARAGRLVTALVDRTGVRRPFVEVGRTLGEGPGVDVILAAGAEGDRALDGLQEVGRREWRHHRPQHRDGSDGARTHRRRSGRARR